MQQSEQLSSDELSYLRGGIFRRLQLTSEEQSLIVQRIILSKKIANEHNTFVVSVDTAGERLRFFHKTSGFYAWGKKIEDFLDRNIS